MGTQYRVEHMDKIGRYEILDELGRGAMGVVLRARDPAIGRLVAIKTIRLVEFSDPQERQQLRERLFREAQSAGVLSHPGIVTIYDVGEENDVTYITMEYVNGPTLEKILSGEEPPEPARFTDWLRQTAAALDYAHRKGIVHRDIKPANVMIHDDGKIRITDFGIAKISASQGMTQTGVAVGTPFYMSPEQIRGLSVDGRADQFSLAVIAYEILTGEKPFHADSLPTLFFQIISEAASAPQRINPTLGPQVDTVLRKAMAKEPAGRYVTCTEFVNALEAACNAKKGWKTLPRGAAKSMPTVVAPVPEIKPARPVLPPVPKPTHAEARSESIFGRMVAILLALVVVGAILIYGPRFYKDWKNERTAPAQEPVKKEEAKPQPVKSPIPEKPSPAPEAAAPSASQPAPAAPSSTTPETPTAAPPQPETKAPATPAPESEAPPPPPKRVERPKPAPVAAKNVLPSIQEVLVTTMPSGATIIFDDGAQICHAPCTAQLPSGRHTLAATLPGYHSEMRIFEVHDQTMGVTVDMKRLAGVLRVESDPPGAAIVINGQRQSQTTPASITLSVGKYSLTVSKDGFRKSDQDFEIKDGSFVKITFTLSPAR
jgi:serine/threonine-protein kinase